MSVGETVSPPEGRAERFKLVSSRSVQSSWNRLCRLPNVHVVARDDAQSALSAGFGARVQAERSRRSA